MAAGVLGRAAPALSGDRRRFIEQLRGAFYAGMLLTYAQGFALLYRASQVNTYRLRLAEVARIWRGGCIIRASLLNDIGAACRINPDLPNLLMDEQIAQALITHAMICGQWCRLQQRWVSLRQPSWLHFPTLTATEARGCRQFPQMIK